MYKLLTLAKACWRRNTGQVAEEQLNGVTAPNRIEDHPWARRILLIAGMGFMALGAVLIGEGTTNERPQVETAGSEIEGLGIGAFATALVIEKDRKKIYGDG